MGASWRVKETLCCFECRNDREERCGNVLFFSVTLLKPPSFHSRAQHTSTGSGLSLKPPIQLADSLTLTVNCVMQNQGYKCNCIRWFVDSLHGWIGRWVNTNNNTIECYMWNIMFSQDLYLKDLFKLVLNDEKLWQASQNPSTVSTTSNPWWTFFFFFEVLKICIYLC